MKNTDSDEKERIASTLLEDIKQIEYPVLGVGAVFCQVCGDRVREGRRVTAYAFRPCLCSPWVVGQTRCVEHEPSLGSLGTLGVLEVTVEGRVGRCVDQGLQREWPVVVASEVLDVSPRGSTTTGDLSRGCAACRCGTAGETGVGEMRGWW